MENTKDAPPAAELLRRALIDLVTECGPRRSFPPLLRLGDPGGVHRYFADDPGYDSGLRADVLERALDGFDLEHELPTCWLTRSGELVPGDLDFAWFAATREAFGRHGSDLPAFFVMTRRGWLDLVEDTGPTLCNIRPRRRTSRRR